MRSPIASAACSPSSSTTAATAASFFARDPFGIKPLYYFQSGTTLLFASEIKAFLHHSRFEKSLAEDLLPLYLCFEYIPGDDTLFAGVKRLPAGHRARWQSGTLTLERYFKPTYRIDETLTLDEWAELIGATVAESCAAHAIADVEVGSSCRRASTRASSPPKRSRWSCQAKVQTSCSADTLTIRNASAPNHT